MTVTVGIILVALSLAILIFALVRAKRQSSQSEPLVDEDTVIQQSFEIVDVLDNSEQYTKILLSQEPVEVRLAKLFDQLFAEGKISPAEKVAKLLVQFAPDLAAGYARLGLAHLRMGNLESAEKNLRTALEIDPEDVRSANNLGYILNQRGRYAESVAVLESVLGEDEQNVVTLVNLGIAKYHIGDVDGAYELLNSAYKKNPNIPEVHLYIGHCLRQFGDEKRAQIAYARYEELKKAKEQEVQQSESPRNEEKESAEPQKEPESSPQKEEGGEKSVASGGQEEQIEEEIVVPDRRETITEQEDSQEEK